MTQVIVSSKFQVVIPKPVRLQAHVRSGQRFTVVVKEGVITLIPEQSLAELRGMLKGKSLPEIREKRDRV